MGVNISVIIPTYSPQEYIYDCLESLKAQTLSCDLFEVILVLNGVKEPYYTKLSSLVSSSDNMFLLYTDQGNVSNARNVGLEYAKGEYITFIDDDDLISPTYLSELYNNATIDCVSLSNMSAFEDVSNKPKCEYISTVFDKWCNKKNINLFHVKSYFSIPVSKMIHRSIIGLTRFNPKFKNGEDGLFMFEISKNIASVKFTSKEAIYYRRIRQSSLSNSIKSDKRYILVNGVSLIWSYTKIYLNSIMKYNFFFYVLRMMAVIKWMVIRFI